MLSKLERYFGVGPDGESLMVLELLLALVNDYPAWSKVAIESAYQWPGNGLKEQFGWGIFVVTELPLIRFLAGGW